MPKLSECFRAIRCSFKASISAEEQEAVCFSTNLGSTLLFNFIRRLRIHVFKVYFNKKYLVKNPLLKAAFILLWHFFFASASSQQLVKASPESRGYSSAFFKDFSKQVDDSIPCLGAFIVYSHDKIIYENYFHGADSTDAFSIKSITKSVVSALAGIAKSKGLLPDLKTPVVQFFPEFVQPRNILSTVWFRGDKSWNDSVRSTLTLHDLLTMQHGWDWNDFQGPVNIFINATDPIRFTMDIPFADTPGTKFLYSSAASSLFGAVLEKSVHTSLKDFAEKNLFAPLGMRCSRWDTGPQGRSIGCSEMFLTVIRHYKIGLIIVGTTTGEIGGYSSALPVLLDRTISKWTAPPKIIDKVLEQECKELSN